MQQHASLSETVRSALTNANELVEWINSRLQGVEITGDHRNRIPAQLFDLSIEHHAGIVRLIGSRIYASGFALVRCEFECFVRGAWLHHCASDEELNRFIETDRIPISPSQMIKAIEQKSDFAVGLLSQIQDSSWNAMNGYTHGGIHQISRRMNGEYIEPNFEDDSLIEVVQFSGAIALIALGQIAAIAERKDIWDETSEKLGGETIPR
jgi:hypothetical protein